jgi:hypothetical protein
LAAGLPIDARERDCRLRAKQACDGSSERVYGSDPHESAGRGNPLEGVVSRLVEMFEQRVPTTVPFSNLLICERTCRGCVHSHGRGSHYTLLFAVLLDYRSWHDVNKCRRRETVARENTDVGLLPVLDPLRDVYAHMD